MSCDPERSPLPERPSVGQPSLLPTTKPPTVLNNLTPGGTYTFQVRAYGKLGYSDWSEPVNRMCI